MPFGTLRVGSRTSSPAVATVSRPMKEKNTVAAAAVTPAMPPGPWLVAPLKKGWKLLMSKPQNAIATKNTRIASLIITMTALVVADSRVPRISRAPHSTTSRIGGRLMWAPCSSTPCGVDTIIGERSASGIFQPIAFDRKLLR